MIRYDPTLVNLTSNFLVLCTNMKYYSYNYAEWVDLSMNIHEGKVKGFVLYTMHGMVPLIKTYTIDKTPPWSTVYGWLTGFYMYISYLILSTNIQLLC